MLNIDQSPAELADLYGMRDYYWYLRSESFRKAFVQPMAAIINSLWLPCLDVGCGEACLADYLSVPYAGFDGSETAIERARQRLGSKAQLLVGRIESPPVGLADSYGVAVFSGILEVLVRPESRVDLLETYRKRFGLRYVVVCDLERLDTQPIASCYERLMELHLVAEGVEVEEVKRCRKVEVYWCG